MAWTCFNIRYKNEFGTFEVPLWATSLLHAELMFEEIKEYGRVLPVFNEVIAQDEGWRIYEVQYENSDGVFSIELSAPSYPIALSNLEYLKKNGKLIGTVVQEVEL